LLEAGASLATSVEEAIAASITTVTCLKNHQVTTELLRPISKRLSGKAILDFSTGGAEEAEELVEMLTGYDADWQIGMINAYPSLASENPRRRSCAQAQ
jgi:3-hydroxyisobutyrate dehydrogenase-like beta-hydroxyacid dehydrogenase